MTTTTTSGTAPARAPLLSTRVLLFGQDGQHAEALNEALRERDLLGPTGLGPLAARAATRTLTTQVSQLGQELLDLDVGSVLIGVWNKRKELLEAARRTSAQPQSRETVVLADHDVHVQHEPTVDVLLEDMHLMTVPFTLALDIEVQGLVAVIERGALVELAQGNATVTGTLNVYSKEVTKRSKALALPRWFVLHGRLTLITQGRPAPS